MKWLKKYLRNYFGFSIRETNGVILVFLLMLCGIAALPTVEYFSKRYGFSIQPAEHLDSLAQVLEKRYQISKPKYSPSTNYTRKKFRKYTQPQVKQTLFSFNPNQASLLDWKKLGTSEYIAQRIINYRNKGGYFKRKEDILKIYGFPKSLYEQLIPYMQLPKIESRHNRENKSATHKSHENKNKTHNDLGAKDEQTKTHQFKTYKKPIIKAFDINTADTATFRQLQGIGTRLSKRIVSMRDKLGGFHSVEQISEVYNLKPEVFIQNKAYFIVDKSFTVKKIAINNASINELKTHPYISYKQAKILVAYRKQHGSYTNIDDLQNVHTLERSWIQKIKPYLTFD